MIIELLLILGGISYWLSYLVLSAKLLFNNVDLSFPFSLEVLLVQGFGVGLDLELEPLPWVGVYLLTWVLYLFYYDGEYRDVERRYFVVYGSRPRLSRRACSSVC